MARKKSRNTPRTITPKQFKILNHALELLVTHYDSSPDFVKHCLLPVNKVRIWDAFVNRSDFSLKNPAFPDNEPLKFDFSFISLEEHKQMLNLANSVTSSTTPPFKSTKKPVNPTPVVETPKKPIISEPLEQPTDKQEKSKGRGKGRRTQLSRTSCTFKLNDDDYQRLCDISDTMDYSISQLLRSVVSDFLSNKK